MAPDSYRLRHGNLEHGRLRLRVVAGEWPFEIGYRHGFSGTNPEAAAAVTIAVVSSSPCVELGVIDTVCNLERELGVFQLLAHEFPELLPSLTLGISRDLILEVLVTGRLIEVTDGEGTLLAKSFKR